MQPLKPSHVSIPLQKIPSEHRAVPFSSIFESQLSSIPLQISRAPGLIDALSSSQSIGPQLPL